MSKKRRASGSDKGRAVKKNKVSVSLMGREYALLTQEDPAHVQRVARYVDRRLREAAITSRAGDATAWALASMTLADELFRAQDENVRLKKELAALSKPE